MTSKMVAKTENVNQTLGMTTDQFRALGLPSRDVVDCAQAARGRLITTLPDDLRWPAKPATVSSRIHRIRDFTQRKRREHLR